MILVAGADISKGRWAVVVLCDGAFHDALLVENLGDVSGQVQELARLAVDVPIGLPQGGGDWPRAADVEAKNMLGKGSAAVFLTPPRPVLDCPDFDAANSLHLGLTGKGLSSQAWGLKRAILEADALAEQDERVIEAHPEVSFREMNGAPLVATKKTWDGMNQRRALLRDHGIDLLDQLGGSAGRMPADDLLDAAAAAWTAHRFETGLVKSLGSPTPNGKPNLHAGRIWF